MNIDRLRTGAGLGIAAIIIINVAEHLFEIRIDRDVFATLVLLAGVTGAAAQRDMEAEG